MKFRILLIGILIVFISGCEDFLNITPETAVTPQNFFQTQSDFEQAVNGAYAPLQSIYDAQTVFGSGGDWMLAEMRSDNTHFTFNVDNRGAVTSENVATFLVESNNGVVANKYNNNFQIIARANEILSQIDQADFDQSVKDRLKGEALFLRAFAYFDLVRNFGGVPLHLEPSGSLEETSLARSSASDVYDQVITDATSAADLLPSKANQQTGRATSGAAYTLLGDVFLTLERWSDAESALSNVTNYSLLPNYADVFDPANEGNDEMVFEVEFLAGTSQSLHSLFPYHFLPRLNDPSIITGVSPAQLNEGGWNTPTPDLIEAYEDTVQDERYAASIGRYSGSSPITGFTYDRTPYIKKYQHDHPSFGQTEQNWPVYRYAEVLLMMAEAINEQGGRLTEAQGYLNEVRDRTGLNDYTATGQADLRDAIMQERRVELAFENKRWHDLVRTGRAVQVMNDFGERVKANPQDYYYAPGNAPTAASFNVTEDQLLYPIPFREINLNPDLEQNPGY
ncbi:RagB/SusD family nutrient uptake outer membrane protein [Aliifodinibius sp. S!AR15-10]|uniref:RagB/SusD family nutrient uptake outer membrane protein n=1 Tax=Aliifodinibius sp. S!AR15-10 TaxID=2950437 RepID=UPI002865F969|nr:RagB/SusD family nutrient uptake outer membrane protein [Aliifodinibius sp. S!AR15-10]MDR8390911.1 RagB/SusD family nutrient uptake outer membrane protein [Aliifodinibius sp. S!AR15-10]